MYQTKNYTQLAPSLSMAPVVPPSKNSIAFKNKLESYLNLFISHLSQPAMWHSDTIKRRNQGQQMPEKHCVIASTHLYWEVRTELTIARNILQYSSHIVVPASLQQETLNKIHQGHHSIHVPTQTNTSLWWLGKASQIKNLVERCPDVPIIQSNTVNWL